jgi:hypothetical protein
MAKQLIGIGSVANDGTGDNLREGATKVNNLINELYTALGDGTNFTSGTFATTTATQAFTNKDLTAATNTFPTLSIKDDASTIDVINLGETITFEGGSGITTTVTGNKITFATDGSIVTETSTDTLTNKTINFANNTITGTANEFNSAVSDGSFSTTSGSETLTNKTIDLTDNTLSGTLAELNTAISDETVVGRATTDTLTNKTLTAPIIDIIDVTGSGSKARFNFANTAALPDATTYTGMFATKTDTSEAFYSESGAWIKLFSENNTIQDISNVIITGISNGDVLKWNASTTRFESAAEAGGITAGSDIDMAGAQLQDAGYISHRSPDSTVVHTLTITVATKTSEHHAFGDGSSNGYVIDGDQSPFLTLAPGVYKFDQADGTNAGHPLRFYIDAAKTTEYTYGVTNSGTPGNAGAYTQIVVDENTMGTLYYQCTAHANMGHALTTPGGRKHTKTSMTGDGSDTTLTIEAGRTVDNVLVFVNGICLVPTDDYTISGTTLTFITAPASSAEVVVRYIG